MSTRAVRLKTDGQLIVKRKKTGELIKESIITRNISSSGISFETKKTFEIGEKLEIAIKFGDIVVRNNLVEIVRVEKYDIINVYGCEFVKIVELESGGKIIKYKGAVLL